MTTITSRVIRFCHYQRRGISLAKRAIAALLLVTIGAWAEFALAPMLMMQSGHMLAEHAAVVNARDSEAMRAVHSGRHHMHQAAEPEQAAKRPCCPGFGHPEQVIETFLTAAMPACDNSHRCCFRQGPQSVPAQARNVSQHGVAPARLTEVSDAQITRESAAVDGAAALRAPPDLFSMILRV